MTQQDNKPTINFTKEERQRLIFNGKRYFSIAVWPEGTFKNEYGDPVSHDSHFNSYEARAVCRGLEKQGFGGEGKIFPIETRIEEI